MVSVFSGMDDVMNQQKDPIGSHNLDEGGNPFRFFEISQTHRTGCGNSRLHTRDLGIPGRLKHRR